MKKSKLLLLIFIFLSLKGLGQTINYKKVESADIIYLLNNLEKTSIYKSEKSDLAVRVYSVTDPSGSAQTGESDEVTNSIYFAVSEYGETPEQYVYRLTSVYNPTFVKWFDDAAGLKLILTYGPKNIERSVTIQVSLKKLIITSK